MKADPRFAVLILAFAGAAFARSPSRGETAPESPRNPPPSAREVIQVIGNWTDPTLPDPSPVRVSVTIEYRHAFVPGASAPGFGAAAEVSFPLGPFRLAAFLSGGAAWWTETWAEERPFQATAGGETVTYLRRVEVTEQRGGTSASAGAGLAWDLPLGGGWRLGGCVGPVGGRIADSWGPGARASVSLEMDTGGAIFLVRIAAEVVKMDALEAGITAGAGVSLSF
jgi:hypothetical protein